MVVRWEDPPPRQYRGKWQRIADELRSRPGESALIVERVSLDEASSARTSLLKYGCKVVTRQWNGCEASVWAVYEP